MNKSSIQLRHVALLGPNKSAATIDFESGINVICGASDTGKSFIVETVDFLLGGSPPLRDIPELVGYDRGRISVKTTQNEIYTFERSLEGGQYKLFNSELKNNEFGKNYSSLKSRHNHGKEDNISGWFLSKIGLFEKRIRKNQKGETNSLSFRDLARLIIVQENEIIKKGSPFLSDQVIFKTSNYSVIKLLLTGVDDSSLNTVIESTKLAGDSSAKIELIDQWLSDLKMELEDIEIKKTDVEVLLAEVNKSIDEKNVDLGKSKRDLNNSIKLRNNLFSEKEKNNGRINEIGELLARFELLKSHYIVDINRLLAIKEAGSLFVHYEKVNCPLCGASPDQQHQSESCDGDIEIIVLAADVEIEKINRLSKELEQTMMDLHDEMQELKDYEQDLDKKFNELDKEISETLSPNIGKDRILFTELIEKRSELLKSIELFNRVERLEENRAELLGNNNSVDSVDPVDTSVTIISNTVLGELAQKIESLLINWHFPDAGRVHFNDLTKDFVINDKPRGSRGKGLRAITHAAVTIGLMEYCMEKSFPHPGFIMLDSPLLSYYKPEGEDDSLAGTDLKERFFEYLVTKLINYQVIIIENEHPQSDLSDKINLIDFTKNPTYGRYGFFPNK